MLMLLPFMVNEQTYLERRWAKVSEKTKRILGTELVGSDIMLMVWRMQFWRAKATWLERKIGHGCTDASCKLCDKGWEEFVNCRADAYE